MTSMTSLLGLRRRTLLLVSLVASLLCCSSILVRSFSVDSTDPWSATSSGSTAKGERGDGGKTPPYCHDVALQFSPLVGGPEFLPLHVSVLMTSTTITPKTIATASSVPSVSNTVACETTNLLRRRQHRFDFLPVNAQDPDVLHRLVVLRKVPGLVRCRTETLVASEEQESSPPVSGTCDDDVIGYRGTAWDGEEGTKRELGTKRGAAGATFSIPMGTTEVPVKSAEEFCELYRRNGGSSLHLISNNCLTFAVRLLAHLEPRLF